MTRRSERGSILILALLVSASAAITGMWVLLRSDLAVRRNRYLVRAAEASRVAVSGLQLARRQLAANPGWAGASISAPDDASQALVVTTSSIGYRMMRVDSVGSLGDSTQTVFADLRAPAHLALGFNAVSQGTILLDDVAMGGRLRANGSVLADGDVDFTGSIETLTGSTVQQVDPAQVVYHDESLPPPAFPLADYQALCSPLLSLPTDQETGAYLLEEVSLTPANNPFGAANALGAYSIDAGGRGVLLRNVYIEGTLLVFNAGGVLIDRGYHHRRVAAHLATLLVQGSLEIQLSGVMNEAWSNRDFNLDGDLYDIHPPLVEGLVHASGTFVGLAGGTLRGTVLAASVTLRGAALVESDADLLAAPVVGYLQAGSWDIVAGSIGSLDP